MRRLLVVFGIVLGACTSQGPAPRPEPTWKIGSSMPTPRTEVAAAADAQGRIHVVGGFTADGEASRAHEIYDPATDLWTAGEQFPYPIHHAMAVTVRGQVWIIGGYRANGSSSARVLGLVDGGWERLADMPKGIAAGAAAVVGGQVHVAGGAVTDPDENDALSLNGDHFVHTPGTDRWKSLATIPTPRDHAAGGNLNGKFVVVGGRDLSLESTLDVVEIYDPASNSWARMPDLGFATGGHAVVGSDSDVIIAGGELTSGTVPVVVRLSGSGESTEIETLPTPRHGLGAVLVGGRVWFVGGGPQPGLSVTGATEGLLLGLGI